MSGKASLRPRGNERILYARIYIAGERVERSTGTADLEEAQRVVARWEHEAEDQSDHPESATTLDGALDALLEDKRAKSRSGAQSDATLRFYEQHAGLLIGALGRTTLISSWESDSTLSWKYIDTRMADVNFISPSTTITSPHPAPWLIGCRS
jgi:hypothetical protein